MRLLFTLIWQQARRHPRRWIVAMSLAFIVAGLWIVEPLYSSYAIDQLLTIKEGATVSYGKIFGFWGLIFVLVAIFNGVEKYVFWELDNRTMLDRREQVYAHVLALGVPFNTQQKSGEIVKQLDEGADALVDMQRAVLLELGPSFLSALVFLGLSFWIQPILAMILIVTLSLYVAVVVFGTKYTSALQYQVNKLWVEAIGRAYDAITNVYSVVSGAQEDREEKTMHELHGKAHRKQRQVNLRWAIIESIHFFMLTRILLVGIGIILYVKGSLTLGQLYFFQFSFFRVLTPFEILANLLPQWNRRIGKVKVAQHILDTPLIVRDKKAMKMISDLKGEIELKSICFSYSPVPDVPEEEDATKRTPIVGDEEHYEEALPSKTVQPTAVQDEVQSSEETVPEALHPGEVLHRVSLTIKAGEHIAIVGHSGAGKSTLAVLLNRFYDVTKGKILIDGVNIKDLDQKWWRSQIGLVLQENIMFNDSILENIRYARPSATKEEVIEAAKRAAAHEFISAMPKKYDTLIGDRGIRLSGGQRQRVAIARAILKNPKIVILDEATSALDSATERSVQQGIKELIAGRTSIIIAHRLSTVLNVDRIAVLDKGKLIAAAPHQELLQTTPLYREMVELQSHGMLAE